MTLAGKRYHFLRIANFAVEAQQSIADETVHIITEFPKTGTPPNMVYK